MHGTSVSQRKRGAQLGQKQEARGLHRCRAFDAHNVMCRCMLLALCSASNGTLLPWKRRRAPTTTGAPTRGRPLVRLAQRSHGVLHKETRPDQDTSAAAAAVVPGRAKLNGLFLENQNTS